MSKENLFLGECTIYYVLSEINILHNQSIFLASKEIVNLLLNV